LKAIKAQADDLGGQGFPETTGLETDMGIASHRQRLKRLEGSRGAAEQHLVFGLSDWAPGCPVAFKSEEEEKVLFPEFRAAALDNLVAAGKIQECDRDCVVFIVEVLVSPPKRDDGYQAD